MKLTNRHSLPSGVVEAIRNDPYTGGGDISVTRLLRPTQMHRLEVQHRDEIVEDAADRIWSLLGQCVHTVLERAYPAGRGIAEERLFTTSHGFTVSGQFDVLEDRALTDFKVTSVWSVMSGDHMDWERQLNLLRLMAMRKYQETGDERYRVDKLQIVAILRDWSKHQLHRDDYPKAQSVVVPIPVWHLDLAQSYLDERVKAHLIDDPVPCTDEERWAKPPVFALMKKGRKTAIKLYEARADAEAALKEKDRYIVDRPGEYTRCESYCSVSKFCPQWQAFKSEAAF